MLGGARIALGKFTSEVEILAKHYGFTDEELDFIINYDINYRMGQEEGDDDHDDGSGGDGDDHQATGSAGRRRPARQRPGRLAQERSRGHEAL